jgi:hypothetical protein
VVKRPPTDGAQQHAEADEGKKILLAKNQSLGSGSPSAHFFADLCFCQKSVDVLGAARLAREL